MSATPNSYKNNAGYVAFQITADLIAAVGAPLVAADANLWVDASNVMQTFAPGERSRAREETYVLGSDLPLTGSGKIPSISIAATGLDTNGKTEAYGLSNPINVFDHILEPAFHGDIPVPFRHAPAGNRTGAQLRTYTGDTKVSGMQEPGSDANASSKAGRSFSLSANGVDKSTIV